jgi:hypothetical protein
MVTERKDQGSGIVTLTELFPMQSYFDSTLRHLAVVDQGVGQQISQATVKPQDTAGYGLALHPSSETPVAVKFQKLGMTGATLTVVLKPGQILYPFGRDRAARFEGFSWGVPFGWLGGGLATLFVLTSPDVELNWPKDDAEVIVQRQRMKIYPHTTAWADVVADTSSSLMQNWPTRFPALTTRRGGNGGVTIDASGRPSIRVQPTRTMFMLRTKTLAAPATIRFFVVAPEAFENAASAVPPVLAAYEELTWGTTANVGGAGVPDQYMVQEVVGGPLITLGCERSVPNGVIAMVTAANANLEPVGDVVYLDVVRYGKI